jgi:membrane associated rhomboid family serine protease
MANIIVEDIKQKIKSGNPVTRLIIINVLVWFFILLFRVLTSLLGDDSFFAFILNYIIRFFSFPISFNGLVYSPWTIITYSFSHIDLMHILYNMLALYWFGQIFIGFTSSKKIIPLYLLGAIAGALFTMFMAEFIPGLHIYRGVPMIGASASVTAIIVAAAVLVPNYRINLLLIGEVKLIYVAIFTVFISFVNASLYSNVGGNLSHLGGALMGYVFAGQYKKGKDLLKPINAIFDWFAGLFKSTAGSNMKVVHKRALSDEEYNYNKKMKEQKVDAILDKISKSGYESLTKAEREFLRNVDGN